MSFFLFVAVDKATPYHFSSAMGTLQDWSRNEQRTAEGAMVNLRDQLGFFSSLGNGDLHSFGSQPHLITEQPTE
jgi:hypothetical protein